MRTIERNYRKNPHTANFLMTFHQAAYGLPAEIDESRAAEIGGDAALEDLLDLVNPAVVPDLRTDAQKNYMEQLITVITDLNAEDGQKARTYTDGVTEHGKWTPGREGNASKWIDRLIAKKQALRAAAPKVAPVTAPGEVEIPANNYAITKDGEVKCYTVDYGKEGTRWEGFLFLNRISSDDRFPIRNRAEKEAILATIREDVEASQILAGLTLRSCRRCHRTLSDTKNPYFSVALGPDCGAM